MCGLIGCAGPLANQLTEDQCQQRVMLVRHRGPDDWGFARAEGVFLGHTRLAIQDTSSAGYQPFEYGNITLTYNGEMWNASDFPALRPATTSDTEVVARLLDTHGEKALDLIDGMWAVAWHDKRDGMVRLARDRWGKVPLYVTTDGATVYWASEYKAIPAGLQAEAVPPGGCIVVDPDGDSYGHQWTIDVPFATSAPKPDEVLHLLRQGVRERLVGDRAIAFLLSGGLDSSLILALAAEQGYSPLVAYTAVLDPASHDLVAARYVAEEYGAELIEVRVPHPNELVIREAVRTIEIPMKAQVEIAMAHMPVMHEVAKDGFAVCLSGEAADELFGGYGGMCIKASKSTDDEYRQIKLDAVEKMARGNFSRVNKVGMRYGVEIRLPFMQAELVELALQASKAESPPAKKLLKQAATGVLPNWIIKRPKQTFQGGTGINGAAAAFTDGPSRYYNQVARELFGYIPRS